jgi:TolB-like protein
MRLMIVLAVLVTTGALGACATAESANKASIAVLSEAIYPKLPPPPKRLSVAVVGFVPLGKDDAASDAFSSYLVEELTMKLVSDGRVTVAERAQLEKVVKELKLQSSGMVSDQTAKQLGQLLGVDGVLLGTYMDQGKEVKVNQKLIATENGQILAATTTTFAKNKVIKKLLGEVGKTRKKR